MHNLLDQTNEIFSIMKKCEQSQLYSFEYKENGMVFGFCKGEKETKALEDNAHIDFERLDYSLSVATDGESVQQLENMDTLNVNSDYLVMRSPYVGIIEFDQSFEKGWKQMKIQKGSVLCCIEAMKIYNDIKSPVNGIIEEILVDNKSLVEYEQPIMKIKVNNDESKE